MLKRHRGAVGVVRLRVARRRPRFGKTPRVPRGRERTERRAGARLDRRA